MTVKQTNKFSYLLYNVLILMYYILNWLDKTTFENRRKKNWSSEIWVYIRVRNIKEIKIKKKRFNGLMSIYYPYLFIYWKIIFLEGYTLKEIQGR